MKSIFAAALAIAALTTVASAQATAIAATFNGVVQSQIGTGVALNSPISGGFIYDTTLSAYTAFTIGGQSVAPGFKSSAELTPNGYTALYTAQVSPVPAGGTLNSTFSVDLEASTTWAASSAVALLTSPELASNLDTTLSSFTYYTGNSDGTNVKSLTATLTGIQVSTVPEPASVAMLLAGVAMVGSLVRRRQQR
jgi:hypothetical protein